MDDMDQLLLERTTKLLRRFNTVTYEMLLKHVEGLPLEELQARVECAAEIAFEEIGMERFAHFVLDCDFLEIRSRQHLSSKKYFVFVKEDWLDDVNIKIRSVIPKVCGGIYREDTDAEDISVVLKIVPKVERPNMTNMSSHERQHISSANPVSDFTNMRIRRSVVFDHGKEIPILTSQTLSTKSNALFPDPSVDKATNKDGSHSLKNGSITVDHEKFEPKKSRALKSLQTPSLVNLPSAGVVNVIKPAAKINEIPENCRMESFTSFKWPLEEFAVTLLGCDQKSYLYLRPVQRSLQDRYEQLKKSLQEWTHAWPTHASTMTVIRKEELKPGMIILAMNVTIGSFVRARVDKVEPKLLPYPVLFTDLDEGDQFRGNFILNFEIPEKFRKLCFQAVKVGLEDHCEYLGTRAIVDVFSQVPDLQGELLCELVTIIRDQKLPVVKLCRASDGSVVCFNSL